MRRPGKDLFIVQLEPDTFELVNTWLSVSSAAKLMGISREGLYQALRDGRVRYGYRWMFKNTYNSWLRNNL